MGIKESLGSVKESLLRSSDDVGSVFGMGSSNMRFTDWVQDIYNEEVYDPHREMQRCYKLQKLDPVISTSVDILVNSLIGKEMKVVSDDEDTQKFFNEEFLPKIKQDVRLAMTEYVVTGNGYMEVIKNGDGDQIQGEGVITNLKHIPHSHRMFIDYGRGYDPRKYIRKYPKRLAEDTYSINYGERTNKKSIPGVAYEPEEVLHFKQGVSSIPVYGRSSLASAIDEGKILRELHRDLAIIARFKAIPKYIFKVMDNEGNSISKKQKEKVAQQFKNLKDFENLFTSEVDIESEKLDYDGAFQNLDVGLDYFKKRITSTLAPSFYTQGDVTNYAVAKEQKSMYYLTVDSMREDPLSELEPFLQEVAKQNNFDTELDLEFGEFDFPTKQEKEEMIVQKFVQGLMSLNEARNELGLEDDEEIGEFYAFDLKEQGGLEGAVEEILQSKDIEGEPTDEEEESSQEEAEA